jgi:hypothetical protein
MGEEHRLLYEELIAHHGDRGAMATMRGTDDRIPMVPQGFPNSKRLETLS